MSNIKSTFVSAIGNKVFCTRVLLTGGMVASVKSKRQVGDVPGTASIRFITATNHSFDSATKLQLASGRNVGPRLNT